MNRATSVADRIERTVNGPMWHGPALTDLLDGVPPERAASKPIAGAHSIWEIVRHITAWAEIALRRMHGEPVDPRPEEDWPPIDGSRESWMRDLDRLNDSHRHLAAAVRPLDDRALETTVAGQEYSLDVMLQGVVEHGTYHGGQIALLRRA
jgi:uncharacterized damage-inducible protein DinB